MGVGWGTSEVGTGAGTDQWEDRGQAGESRHWLQLPEEHMLPTLGPHTAKSSSVSCPSSDDFGTRPRNNECFISNICRDINL